MKKYSFYIKNVTKLNDCDYKVLLTVCKNDKVIASSIYAFDHEADMQNVHLIACDILTAIEAEEDK